jgi:hypothetical protein
MESTESKKPETCGNCNYYRHTRCCWLPPQVFQAGGFPSASSQPFPNPVGWCGQWRPVGFIEEWRKKQK